MKRSLQHTFFAALAVVPFVGGCGSEAGEAHAEPVATAAPSGTGSLENLGTWRGHWDGKQLTFAPANDDAAGSGIQPQGFIKVPDTKVVYTTKEAIVVNSACPQWNNPSIGYFTSGTHALATGSVCPDGHLCATVRLANTSSRAVSNAFAQLTQLTPQFYSDNSVAVPAGYPLDNSQGLWSYGNLNAVNGGADKEWRIKLPNCNDFDFTVSAFGTVTRTSYDTASYDFDPSEWAANDACAISGHGTVGANGPDKTQASVPVPFPFTLYDKTFDPTTKLTISTNGAVGASPATGASVTLPAASKGYTIFPFWARLTVDKSNVCYGTTGTAPNRKFVVTWKDADLTDTPSTQEDLTFSAVLSEGSDLIEFWYQRWSDTHDDWTAFNDESMGSLATVGLQKTTTIATLYKFHQVDEEFLPMVFDSEQGPGRRVVFTPNPGNEF